MGKKTDDFDKNRYRAMGTESFRVYKPAGHAINIYKTINAGKTWELETRINTPVEVDRVYVIHNAKPDAKLLITEAGDRDIVTPKRDVYVGKTSD